MKFTEPIVIESKVPTDQQLADLIKMLFIEGTRLGGIPERSIDEDEDLHATVRLAFRFAASREFKRLANQEHIDLITVLKAAWAWPTAKRAEKSTS